MSLWDDRVSNMLWLD